MADRQLPFRVSSPPLVADKMRHQRMEADFVRGLAWLDEDHWNNFEMPWNTMDGIKWTRCEALAPGQRRVDLASVGLRADMRLFAVKSVEVVFPLETFGYTRASLRAQANNIKVLKVLKSKYIVRCLGCGRSNAENGIRGNPTMDVFFEYCVRGSLEHIMHQRNRPFEEIPYIRQYTFDLLRALCHMQRAGVVHGDIQMSNCFLADDCVKLAGFSGAKIVGLETFRQNLPGTMGMVAPEVLAGNGNRYASDVFALGCTIIEMGTGWAPATTTNLVTGLDAFVNPMTGELETYSIPPTFTLMCRDFLKHCLCMDPGQRWTAAELMHHPFVQQRTVNNTLPYSIQLHPFVRQCLLNLPARRNQDLPDNYEPITRRAYRYLTSSDRPSRWGWRLMGCTTDTAMSFPESLSRSDSSDEDPHPLPPLRPNFIPNEGTHLPQSILRAFPDVINADGSRTPFASLRRAPDGGGPSEVHRLPGSGQHDGNHQPTLQNVATTHSVMDDNVFLGSRRPDVDDASDTVEAMSAHMASMREMNLAIREDSAQRPSGGSASSANTSRRRH